MTQTSARSTAPYLVILAVVAALGACGGGSGTADGAAVDSLPPTDGSTTPSGQADDPADQSGRAGQEDGTEAPVGDTAGEAGASSWTTGASAGREGAGQHALLTEVRTARHDGYDRIVFEFESTVPAYEVRYVSGTIEQCGSGRPAQIEAPVGLQVTFPSAAAHTDQGAPTVSDRSRQVSLPVLRTAHITCDFEGRVEWALGLEQKVPYRAFVLNDPARVVIDLQHP